MSRIVRPWLEVTLPETRRLREKERMRAVAEFNDRRNGVDESIQRLNGHLRASRHTRGRVDMRSAARELAERVFAGQSEEEGQE